MTEEYFEELVNLYLDNEIGRQDLAELKYAVKDNLVWRRRFERACQLHQAASKALSERSAVPARHGSSQGGGAQEAHGHRHGHAAHSGRTQSATQKQERLHRNAAVSAQAERQVSTGAAASISMRSASKGSSNSGSRSSSNSGSGGAMIPFFSSTLGMVMGGLCMALIIGAAAYSIGYGGEEDELYDENSDNMLGPHLRDPAEVAAMMPGLIQNTGNFDPAEAMRARLLSPSGSGNSVARALQPNILALPAPPDVAAGNTAAWRLQVSTNISVGPVTFEAQRPALGSPPVLDAPAPANNDSPPAAENQPPKIIMP